MFINGLRIFYIVFPCLLFVWFMVYHDSFVGTIDKINSLQGQNGVLVINSDSKETWGEKLGDWLEEKFGENADTEWRLFFTRTGRDLDTVIRHIENYWLWGLLAAFTISGIIILYAYRNK